MNFASDNTAGIAPEILQALAAGNDGFDLSDGNFFRNFVESPGEIAGSHSFHVSTNLPSASATGSRGITSPARQTSCTCASEGGFTRNAAAAVLGVLARTSERQGRLIDSDETASMERKKSQGYF